ncbi:MAG TPA: hypothetical protein PKD53_03320 [Chloroflexaceae bacterium]|nr:hypothetical protein [Chloroflexaceae bacterium]
MSLIAGNLAVVQRLLDGDGMPWCVVAGAAAYLYGNRRPIQDVDLLVPRGRLPAVVQLLQGSGKAVQFDGQRILWRGIKLFDDLTVRRSGRAHPLQLDQPMQLRVRRLPLLGALVSVAAPEDVVAHKLLLLRGPAEGKHDQEDAAGVVRRQSLDLDYLRERARLLEAEALLRDRLAELGVTLG